MSKNRIKKYFNYILFTLFSTTVFISFPYSISAQNESQPRKLEQLAPEEFVTLQELTADGKMLPIPSKFFRTIIAKNSRLAVSFKRDLLLKTISFNEKQKEWKNLQETFKNQKISAELQPAMIQQFLLESVRYEVSVAAQVVPESGEEFDLPVEGFTSVLSSVNQEGKIQTIVTTMERRLFQIDVDAIMNELKLTDSLPDTIIVFPEAKVSEGDRLVVNITNHHGISPKSAIWELEINDIGLYTKQDATLLLVKRLGDPTENEDLENNFKPAPGTSFLLKYRSRSKLWNFIDPAVGINGSFLDFRSDKDLEVGAGFVVSFFNGIIQINYGWNLHVNKDRQYWSIGLGFLDITGKLMELKKD